MTTVLVCDDSPLAREALRRAVATVPGVERVAGRRLRRGVPGPLRREQPDLVLVDVRMPGIGGVEAARRILGAAPHAAVIMMTMAEDVDGVARAVNAGRPRLPGQGRVAGGAGRDGDPGARRRRGPAGAPRPPGRRGRLPPLTERELQVLRGMGRGRSNSEIGKELYLSEDTVKTHARRLFRKLGAADRAQAVAMGFRWGLVR